MTNSEKLHRSRKNSMIFGVAGGMAEYFDIDPTLMRIAWVLFILASGGTALIAYVVLAVIMPKDDSKATEPKEVMRENIKSLSEEAVEVGQKAKDAFMGPEVPGNPEMRKRRRSLLAFVLIAVGVLILLGNLGVFFWWRWDIFWPLILIGIGVAIVVGRARRS